MSVATDTKKYVCDQCGKDDFTTERGYLSHLRSHETVACPECGRKMSKLGLGNHRFRMHNVPSQRAARAKRVARKARTTTPAPSRPVSRPTTAVPEVPGRRRRSHTDLPEKVDDDLAEVAEPIRSVFGDSPVRQVPPRPREERPTRTADVAPLPSRPAAPSVAETDIQSLLDLLFPSGIPTSPSLLKAVGEWISATETLLDTMGSAK